MTDRSLENTQAKQRSPKSRGRSNLFVVMLKDPKSCVGLCLFLLFILVAIFAKWIAPYDPIESQFMMLLPPSKVHLLGTTSLGQDVFSQFIYGLRTTLIVGLGAGILSTIVAILIGVTAGFVGGVVDSILNALCNIFLVMPALALLIIFESYLHSASPLVNGVIIAFTGWAWGARVFRSISMTISSRDYIAAAKLSGASTFRIIYAEILPNMMSQIASNIMYASLGAVLAESGLAFLGFEAPDASSWGSMLYWSFANGALLNHAWWWFLPPGIGIALLGTSFAFMNYAVDQITNPRLRNVMSKRKVKRLLTNLNEGRAYDNDGQSTART